MIDQSEWALVGNPNCGKTTLFNRLTGANQHVGNWPGVTVEKVSGSFSFQGQDIHIIDLPGLYALADGDAEFAADELVAQQEIGAAESSVYINVVDGSNLERHLFLTSQLLDKGLNIVVAVNMMDNVREQRLALDLDALSQQLNCPVAGIASSRGEGLEALKAIAAEAAVNPRQSEPTQRDVGEHYQRVDTWLAACISQSASGLSLTDRIDNIVLHKYLGFPVFLAVVYAMFMFSINIGSAFIDLFDQVAGVIFVEAPKYWFSQWGVPDWLAVFLTDGLGGGIQLVASFVPVIAAMFLILAWLEDSGYMARAAFVVDRLMRTLGLPGKAFIPLVVGFGCNVPAVMATRTLNNERDRITAILMAPFMSCGARLTVYALFAAAFFPSGGHNMVFALYVIGILIAVLSAFAMKKTLLQGESGHFVLELPNYHLPLARNILLRTWHRLKGFVVRAGKAIVIVVMVLNVLNSFGTDGTVGNQDSEKSVLSAIGKTITPIFEPMGLDEDNWPATVGIFTGIFAKEVVVGTLDSLYSQPVALDDDAEFSFWGGISGAFATVPENLAGLADTVLDPLGFSAIETDLDAAAEAHEIEQATFTALQKGFGSTAAAFAYLLFVLLYIPCVATVGAIYRELNWQWSAFITLWTFGSGYGVAVGFYQAAIIASQPATSLAWLVGIALAIVATLWGLRRHAKGVEFQQRDIIARSS